eukprot:4502910-Amphidinium_carterae.1
MFGSDETSEADVGSELQQIPVSALLKSAGKSAASAWRHRLRCGAGLRGGARAGELAAGSATTKLRESGGRLETVVKTLALAGAIP